MRLWELEEEDRISAVRLEIEALLTYSPEEVRVLWRRRFRKALPPALTTHLQVRMLAWKIQEEAFGGHDGETLRLLKAFATQDPSKVMLYRKLKSGTTIVREYQGVRHVVTISEDGFVWEGRTYGSLSAIAQAITGSNWNGPRFFGLRNAGRLPGTAS